MTVPDDSSPPPVSIVTDTEVYPELMAALSRVAGEITFIERPAGHVFYGPEDPGDEIFLLNRGRVRLYTISPEGRALTVLLLDSPAVFGEMALVEGWQHDNYAVSVTPCQVGVARLAAFRQALNDQPTLALRLMGAMSLRLRAIERKLADIAFKSVPQRLAAALLGLWAERRDTPPSVRSTHQQLAEMIGSHRETVTKAIGDFRAAGLIQVDDEAIYLADLARLGDLARS